MQLDEIDHKILNVLQKNGRISNQELADQVGLSPSPCLRRVKVLEESGTIQGYVALLDPAAVGRNMVAIVQVRLDHQTSSSVIRFEKEILKYPQILECDLLAGDWDYVLRVAVRDLDEFLLRAYVGENRWRGQCEIQYLDEAGEIFDGASAGVNIGSPSLEELLIAAWAAFDPDLVMLQLAGNGRAFTLPTPLY